MNYMDISAIMLLPSAAASAGLVRRHLRRRSLEGHTRRPHEEPSATAGNWNFLRVRANVLPLWTHGRQVQSCFDLSIPEILFAADGRKQFHTGRRVPVRTPLDSLLFVMDPLRPQNLVLPDPGVLVAGLLTTTEDGVTHTRWHMPDGGPLLP